MKRSPFPRQYWTLAGILVGMASLFVSAAAAQTPSIEGTFQLVSRTLPNGMVVLSPSMDRQAAESNHSSGSRDPYVLSSCNSGESETRNAWYKPRVRLVPRAAYAGAYSKGENSPYLPLWSYASPSSVTR